MHLPDEPPKVPDSDHGEPEGRTEEITERFDPRVADADSFPGDYDTGPLIAQPAPREPAGNRPVPESLRDHPRYLILEVLGGGGMGTVFKAEHRYMSRLVALKVLNRNLLNRPAMIERFHREVRAAAALSHENIVQAFDADQAGENHFLVMEYVAGKDLERLVTELGPRPPELAAEYCRQAALGMQHAFERGMVHHDIKPQNLMLTEDGRVKILDFGLARYLSEQWLGAEFGEVDFIVAGDGAAFPPEVENILNQAATAVALGGAAGTPDYMAPEEILNPRGVDVRADIYSLGCTLYRLLTGRVPFPGGDTNAKLRAHLRKRPPRLEGVPSRLADVVLRMMAKDPADRYQTPLDVVRALVPLALPRGRVLIVENDIDDRLAMRLTLEQAGYTVAEAANGLEALDAMRRGPLPDLVLLDLLMPVMDGFHFLEAQRADSALAGVPVVVVSAVSREQARAAALGAAHYVHKPLDYGHLQNILEQQGLGHDGLASAALTEPLADKDPLTEEDARAADSKAAEKSPPA